MGQSEDDGDPLALLFDELEPKPQGTTTPTYRWRDLDPDTVRTAWTELDLWVRWFVSTYRLSTSVVPDCWWRHAELVAELYALQRAEQASYGEADSGFGPLGFHERMSLAVERLRVYTKAVGCVGLQAHREAKPRVMPVGDSEFLAWSSESHQLRTTPQDHTNRTGWSHG
ncbi:hypothetical protein NG701_16760 [Pseudarthrobacter sp. HLT3-5]|uniref:hypothetical protein n=1 Tax=Pseudarthrobacter cellobiosi TaxID=2953654 RepID=UPI00208ECB0B|nr:hypothetical protein [Pseudarthrobacter sp. HLT3-5]MCO4276054.1 hypothetical protein [Pseudarthrobacter sp. HLT3-5]